MVAVRVTTSASVQWEHIATLTGQLMPLVATRTACSQAIPHIPLLPCKVQHDLQLKSQTISGASTQLLHQKH